MKHERLAGNQSIDRLIHHCLSLISRPDQQRFLRKFRGLGAAGDEVMHTFRELVVGAFLAQAGLAVKYTPRIDGQTPDWVVLRVDQSLECIVEVLNFHIDLPTERLIKAQPLGKAVAYPISAAGRLVGGNDKRLRDKLREKAEKYESLADAGSVPYVVAIYTAFEAAVEPSEIGHCLFEPPDGVFAACPHVSGVLHFVEEGGRYNFVFYTNPNALRPFSLPSGEFGCRKAVGTTRTADGRG